MDRHKVASELLKLAGDLLGPGVPDGTGPMGETDDCPFEDEDDVGDAEVVASDK